ncbi:hypothetical protein LXA43DRAFT_1097455 [Ganoderma leucocontextum]|nr:hypothetical protein LXA43DRAFT_1097455 [Ganoderma leucocontextum]
MSIDLNPASLAPPAIASRPESRPDSFRGFGVNIPRKKGPKSHLPPRDVSEVVPADTTVMSTEEVEQDGASAQVGFIRITCRGFRRRCLSSVGGGMSDESMGLLEEVLLPVRSPEGEPEIEGLGRDDDEACDADPDQGSANETSEDESIGEWLNLSDEECRREERLHRRQNLRDEDREDLGGVPGGRQITARYR